MSNDEDDLIESQVLTEISSLLTSRIGTQHRILGLDWELSYTKYGENKRRKEK